MKKSLEETKSEKIFSYAISFIFIVMIFLGVIFLYYYNGVHDEDIGFLLAPLFLFCVVVLVKVLMNKVKQQYLDE
ncbi:hypothetical protein AV654_19800 [Paenibacillus elgii]|uniref:Uncharacterized protein n=1 Tax=Paenibacillus elgii TaxID=189691 RepID=A0A163XPD3_9BACL|nr:hypothetical protein AV654_19800 [Paenibacillus elgii]